MGRVVVDIEIFNAGDEEMVRRGHMKSNQVRHATLKALVDTGCTLLSLPEEEIKRLGVAVVEQKQSRFANGQTALRKIYGPITIKVMGRSHIVTAVAGHAGVPALLGQVPLEVLDLMVDPKRERLVPGHPESPNEAVYDMF